MLNPEIIEEKPITMGELKDELERIRKRDKELNYRETRTEEYLHHFVTLNKEKRDELRKKLEGLNIPRLKVLHISKMIDLLPGTLDEVKIILQGYPMTVNNENMKKIADTIKKFIPEKKK